MKLKPKILLLAIVPLVFSTCIIGFNISQLIMLKSSTEEVVESLITVEELNSSAKGLQKSLSGYALNVSESNKNDINQDLESIQTIFNELVPTLNEEQQVYAEKIKKKYEEVLDESTKAVNEDNQAEIKRQSIRTKGLINDVIELKRNISTQYANMQADLQQNINQIIWISVILLTLLLIETIVGSYIAVNRLVKRIYKVIHNAEEIANGNLGIEIEDNKNKDEIDFLQTAFKKMTNNLREFLTHVQDSSSQVAASAEELMASADETMKGAELISTSIQEVSSGAEKQSMMSIESTQSAEDSLVAVKEISQKATLAQELSISTGERTKQGSNYVKETVLQMERINQSVEETDGALVTLNNQTKEIVQVLSKITEVADQTNLLSLNASIEAARARKQEKVLRL